MLLFDTVNSNHEGVAFFVDDADGYDAALGPGVVWRQWRRWVRRSTWACVFLSAARLAAPEPAGPDSAVLDLALRAAACAESRDLLPRPSLLTLIDYSLASTEPRLWVIDRSTGRVLFHELVTHGRGSGEDVAERFSNRPGSYQTSLGLFVTGETYVGRNGYSLRLDGLESGVNDRARERAIVIHGASYASPAFASRYGRLGRSWGCPAVRLEVARELIDTIGGGTPIFAYSAKQSSLGTSIFLNGCAGSSSSPSRGEVVGVPRSGRDGTNSKPRLEVER